MNPSLPQSAYSTSKVFGLLLLSVLALGMLADEIREPLITDKDRSHWSFQSIQRPPLPELAEQAVARNPIDLFVLEKLEDKGLSLAPQADRETLIRRVSFDLIGLPPSPSEVDAFVNDPRPNAYDHLVDQLLGSPQFGERWAQHWLDLARFAESDGFEHDIVRKNAWRYRDWVVQALNRDLPFNRFLAHQLAGDEAIDDSPEAELGTGFLVAGPDMPDINLTAERRHIVLNEITSTVGAVFMGLGVGCAQCHDHKFDPLSQADFYRLRAFFENMAFPKKNKQLGHIFTEPGNTAPTSHLAIRGDFRRPGSTLSPAFPRIANPLQQAPTFEAHNQESTYRRTELARWLTSPKHPLTSRVIVNRLWQHHFNRPLVATPNDFGSQGQPPSHPKLLDYLASELLRQKWSLKRLHRLMVSSQTYRQASRGRGDTWKRSLAVDPDNQFYSRMDRRRLTGEAIRDAMLNIAGLLQDRQGGPSDRPPLPAEVQNTLLRKNHWTPSANVADHHRRSIYIFVRRNLRYPMFDVFDRPDANASCARRSVTTTAPQSLNLLNSEFSLRMAQSTAQLIDPGTAPQEAIRKLYRHILGRDPKSTEIETMLSFLPEDVSQTGKTMSSTRLVEASLALFNLNEFLYVD